MKINPKALIEEDLTWFLENIRKVPTFSILSTNELMHIVSKMRCYEFHAGTALVNQGESANLFFIVQEGHLEVSVKKYFFRKKRVAFLKSGDFFGESVLVSNSKRTATVIAKTDVTCFVLLKPTFKSILIQNPLFEEHLRTVFSRRKRELRKV